MNNSVDQAVAVTPLEPTSRVGLTTRVVRGSLWSIGGQAATLLATLIATPFVIRLLGAELFGLLALINVLLGYLSFADMGMGWASTHFASDAHGRGDEEGEAKVVWTALVMAAGPSLIFALALVVGAPTLVHQVLNLPGYLHEVATVAIRIATIAFVARALTGVMNSPELARLRMDLLVLINAGTLIAQLMTVPVVLFVGGGFTGAMWVIAAFGVVALALHVIVGMRLSPSLRRPRIDTGLCKPLARFGGGVLVTAFATIVLSTVDKIFLSRYVSVQALAYYAVAFNLSFILTQAPLAMVQSLLPAFSQLKNDVARRMALRDLYWRALRGTLLWVAPVAVFICVIARPFFTLWAGPEFGRESTPLMYLLAVGFVFEAMAYIPFTLLVALGRTDLVAKCHVGVLIPYVIVSALAIRSYGAYGAAIVWSLRAIVSLIVFAAVASQVSGFRLNVLPAKPRAYLTSMIVLLVPLIAVFWLSSSSVVRIGVGITALAAHSILILTRVLENEERSWLMRFLPQVPWRRSPSEM